MNRLIPLAGALLAALSLTAVAQTADRATSTPTQSRMTLDANNDGVIDRSEAAAHPWLATRFDELDRNRDGRLDASERPAYKGHGKRGGMGLQRMDRNGDGRVTRVEYDAAQAAWATKRQAAGATGAKHARAPVAFDTIDTNRDGVIVEAEWRAHHERMRPQREAEARAKFERRFVAADINRDGKLGRVEVSEKMPRLAERFDALDANGDGFLSRDELRAARRGR